jgi:lysophospholipase L1-like esterase
VPEKGLIGLAGGVILLAIWFLAILPYRRPCILPFSAVFAFWLILLTLALLRFARPVAERLGMMAFGVGVSLALIEGGFRLHGWLFPVQDVLDFHRTAYASLSFEPHPALGWTLVSESSFPFTGNYPNCARYEAEISTNSLGFRDRDWPIDPPPGETRIAVIGDSFVEAMQVGEAQTAVGVLEDRLNRRYGSEARRFEVMNLGISNYGVGQYLLIYEQVAADYQPDLVFVFVAYLHYSRTTQLEVFGTALDLTLQVRPGYELSPGGELIPIPLADYEAYREAVDALNADQYNGQRQRVILTDAQAERQYTFRESPWLYIRNRVYILRYLSQLGELPLFAPDVNPPPAAGDEARIAAEAGAITEEMLYLALPDLTLNEAILAELARQAHEDGGQIVFVDAAEYLKHFGGPADPALAAAFSDHLEAFAREQEAGYLNLSDPLYASRLLRTQYPCDMHFTPLGNAIFADAMFGWLEEHNAWDE